MCRNFTSIPAAMKYNLHERIIWIFHQAIQIAH